ncbi:MAG: 50S ribosome-binding GTPase [Candidatus Poribacteria bacterium]|nr:50S ribosome-binding GTPase [Candidatus Poribacteria bacterium]
MPANLPPEYYKLKHQLEASGTDDERLQLLEEMLRIAPKHKGTEKVRADLRTRVAKIRKGAGKKQAKKGRSYHVPKQGAGQIVLIGTPNVGKSQIVASFTNAKPPVSPTPYTTHEPVVGMLSYENIQFQLIDTPPITADFVQPWVFDLVRNADLVMLVVSLASDEVLDQVDIVKSKLTEAKIQIAGVECTSADADEPFSAPFTKTVWITANQMDDPGAVDRLEILQEFYADEFQIYPLSATNGQGLDRLQKAVYTQLEILRVYTKSPGKPVDYEDPIVLLIGSTVIDAATALHKDFAENFKFARIWGPNWHDGQPVSRDDVVHDGDILEFHV